ncbi:MAG: hypothetical protein M1814_004529 [Vezdaea aestivalis]|nr:MAG: hypothetical protein M1814_004529 [Vezdaea aestivalis]
MTPASISSLELLKGRVSDELYQRLLVASSTAGIQRTTLPDSHSHSLALSSTPPASLAKERPNTDAESQAEGPLLANSPLSSSLVDRKRKAHGEIWKGTGRRTKAVSASGKKVFQPLGNLKLRCDHPVNAEQIPDVWKTILSYSPPKFLRSAWLIDRNIYWALKHHSSIWRMSRLEYYGFDMPDPPLTLDERGLNTLVEGTKCQSCGGRDQSGNNKSRTIYWNIPARMCSSCFARDTVKVDGTYLADLGDRILGIRGQLGIEAWRYFQWSMPFAVKRGGSYRGSTTSEDSEYLTESRRCTRHYCTTGVDKYRADFLAFVEVNPSDPRLQVWTGIPADRESPIFPGKRNLDEITSWGKERMAKAKDDFAPLAALESFMADRKVEKAVQNRMIKEDRVEFFIQRAAASDPPLTPDNLRHSAAYQRSIVITRRHSEECWKKLEAKIREEQAAAPSISSVTKPWASSSFRNTQPSGGNFGLGNTNLAVSDDSRDPTDQITTNANAIDESFANGGNWNLFSSEVDGSSLVLPPPHAPPALSQTVSLPQPLLLSQTLSLSQPFANLNPAGIAVFMNASQPHQLPRLTLSTIEQPASHYALQSQMNPQTHPRPLSNPFAALLQNAQISPQQTQGSSQANQNQNFLGGPHSSQPSQSQQN